MSSQDNNGFLLPFEDNLPHSNQGENVFSSSRYGGHRASLYHPPPPVTLPMLRFPQFERYESTQSLFACRHKDGNFVPQRLEQRSIIKK